MSKKLKLAFLWHMHQPYYKDDKEKRTLMPWVFLHAIKDYYDIPWYSENFPSIKATYNLVPSLIYQLKSYIDHSANDLLLDIIVKPVTILEADEMEFLKSYIFLSNEKNMIKPLERYYKLYLKYKAHDEIESFSEDELNDAQVLFLLSWCGNYLREHSHVVKRFLQKGKYFSYEEKLELVQALREFLPKILQYYKELQELKKITLSTTPYYHPITPLLLDINSAREARADVNLPNITSSFHDYGVENTKKAIEYYEETFGVKPSGFWPAEGSISQNTAELFVDNSLQWFCSDEEVLYKSIHNANKQNIYKNYRLEVNGKNIDVRFRDHYLSDLIGFEYSNKDPMISAHQFVRELKKIYDSHEFSPLVNVILDGENAWEFFPDNAMKFFKEFYTLVESTDWIECVTMDDVTTDESLHVEHITSVATGSWINGNFDIWIGNKQKNRAWELLDSTFIDYEKNKTHLSDEVKSLIDREFMIALGSDWFWWYGDDHFTVLSKEFDDLFRRHLINIYQYMGMIVPAQIYTPIVKDSKVQQFHIKPTDCIYPKIDGKKSNYFEWLNSGVIDIKKEFSVMDSTSSIIDIVHYGYNENSFYFLFEGKIEALHNNAVLELVINDNVYDFDIIHGQIMTNVKDVDFEIFCSEHSVEIEINTDGFSRDRYSFKFFIKEDGKTLQAFPVYSDFFIEIENLKIKNWYV